ncbi:hypothetical protein KVV02_000912 [Mortierella alpina]|uniref:Microbial-type PARG catalytic domain-containing protein n=1 Tax=Mortierella alpina TaxID=64518 RepID=A0A9P8IE93_MORAP|nr:hypothetical protein KVV02_000912 [Mortierella alpina]
MTMPFRWSVVVLLLLFLCSLLTLSRISLSSRARSHTNHSSRRYRSNSSRRAASSPLLLHHLQEEQHLRDRNAQILQDLEENDLQLELDCASPPSASAIDPAYATLSQEEQALQQADFELELAREIQHQVQKHHFDGTLLNESPSALQRHLEHKLRNQKRLLSAYRASRHQQAVLSYSSQECIAWRARQQLLQRQEQRQGRHTSTSSQSGQEPGGETGLATALTRFQQFHPNRRDLDIDSVFGKTLAALGQKRYTDPNGYVVELDPIKIMAGSRRASAYQNDDIHVLVLDMQWDPEVTVVVGNVLDETVKLRQEGYRPVMLNVGNSQVPGGDYHLDSATDNEADLFRRTTLHQCLDQEPRRSRFYPLEESGGIYCPNQAVFRHGLDRDNEFMDRFEWISVVSVAPIPKLETREKDGGLGGVQFLEGEDDLLRRRILAAMKVGVSQGHDALVLPPHGTDAGQNPAEAIAAIYRSIIGRDFMGGRKRFQTYKKIVMVLDPEQADKVVNETSSYRPTQPPSATSTPLPVDEEEDEGSDEAEDEEEVELENEEDDQTEGKLVLQPRKLAEAEEDDSESRESEAEDDDEESRESEAEDDDEESDNIVEKDPEDYAPNQDESASIVDSEDEEPADGEVDDGDEETVDQLVPDDEVSESEALEEEQFLEEDAELTDEALDEDLNDVPKAVDFTAESDEDEDEDHTRADIDQESQSEEGDEGQHDDEEEELEPEEFVPITETVREVFERMLEQRSLLIVKNRARGLLDTEDLDSGKNTTDASTSSTQVDPSNTTSSASTSSEASAV